ncbi:kinase-like domain-containing protein [Amylocarpus encephaloides]|uniref:non-specific serine/threonine protein kinase n=1 Tax=Amylocarpus encephaloides TaxID=45428 RepID=A0A9P8C1V8_9HELO|nr:kinase-like domain-containing protein [Amylocarpus encephaloides]
MVKGEKSPSVFEFFIHAVKEHIKDAPKTTERTCRTISLQEELEKIAIQKNGSTKDWKPENLLFPPTVLGTVLTERKLHKVLGCTCRVCENVPGGRNRITDNNLVDLIANQENAIKCQRLVAALVFIGAGFAIRHMFSWHIKAFNTGMPDQLEAETLWDKLFKPYRKFEFFPDNAVDIFKQAFELSNKLFNPPEFNIGDYGRDLSRENLPFINDEKLEKADRSSFGTIFEFSIHAEFRSKGIPEHLVRKELRFDHDALREREMLEFFAASDQPATNQNVIRLLFWYRYYDKINFVFPKYNGSLKQYLDGGLNLDKEPSSIESHRGPILKHWLWQGLVELLAALEFVHSRDHPSLGSFIVAHFDLKPANILIDNTGKLIVTDFGMTRIKPLASEGTSAFSAQAGDYNYQPPPLEKSTDPVSRDNGELRWCRSYDVWSLACIMTEVIEFLPKDRARGGPTAVEKFRRRRRAEDGSSQNFWKKDEKVGYVLKPCVLQVLDEFEQSRDQHLDAVTRLLRKMFSIHPLHRPPIAECLNYISEDVPMDRWPLLYPGETPIAGLGTKFPLRDMYTSIELPMITGEKRCKMYMLLKERQNDKLSRVRLALGVTQDIETDPQATQSISVVTDSARLHEEAFIASSLFDKEYAPRLTGLQCAFEVMHDSLTFVFNKHQFGNKVLPVFDSYDEARMSETTYTADWTYNTQATSSDTSRNSSMSAPSLKSAPTGMSMVPQVRKPPHRLVIFVPCSSPRCITLDLNAKGNEVQFGLTGKKETCIRVETNGANLMVGVFAPESRNLPGIPISPRTLLSKESIKMKSLELDFVNMEGLNKFKDIYYALFPERQKRR